jgi:LmbE family N-acetylglucosaminyl deacetylase
LSGRPDTAPVYADPIQAPGTDEREWQAWDGWDRLPDLRLPAAGRVVVAAAHPDDEVLGLGGTLARLAAAGLRVTVVSVTDGEGSHPGSTAVGPARLAALRAEELRAALAELGAPDAEVRRLRVPDTQVARHQQDVAAALRETFAGAALCLAPWTGDVHADHEAVGRAALVAAAQEHVRCLMYPVWTWHWARPGDPRVPWEAASAVRLDPAELARKRAAVGRFVTQIRPLGPGPADRAVLPPDELAHHLRPFEVVFG